MGKKEGKRIIANIPNNLVWESFLNHIESIYGKTYGHIGNEVQNALIQYMENSQKGTIDEIEIKYQKQLENVQNETLNMQKKHQEEIHSFHKEINILKESNKQMESLKKVNEDQKQIINVFESEITYFKGLKEELTQKINQYDKLRNRYDHIQERFIKNQRELNTLERENSKLRVVVAKVQKLSLFERLLNRLPDEVKQLEAGE